MSYTPIICLDFDGVLHSYKRGWAKGRFASAKILDGPTPGAMDWLRDAYESERVKVAIFSSRSKTPWGRFAMKRWFYRHLKERFGHQAGPHMDPLYLEIYEWVTWPWFKPSAFVTVDDRAVTFSGEWPLVGSLLAFKPWNKR